MGILWISISSNGSVSCCMINGTCKTISKYPDLSSDIYECESILSDSIVLLLVFPQEIQQLLLS